MVVKKKKSSSRKQHGDDIALYVDETIDFIKNHPLTSVLGAVVIGYALGSLFKRK